MKRLLRRTLWLCAVTLLTLTLAPTSALAYEQDELDAITRLALEADPPVFAIPATTLVEQLAGRLEPAAFDAALSRIASDAKHPLARSLAAWYRARILSHTGAAEEAEALLTNTGFLTRWHVVGPFPNPGGDGFSKAFPPEQGINLNDNVAEGRFPFLRWRELHAIGTQARVPLNARVEPTHDAVVYALTTLDAAAARKGLLWISSGAPYAAWLNGQPIARESNPGGELPDAGSHPIQLKKGDNVLVIKLANQDGEASFHARLTTPELEPLVLPHGDSVATLWRTPFSSAPEGASLAATNPILAELNAADTPLHQALAARLIATHQPHRVHDADGMLLGALERENSPSVRVALIAADTLIEPWRRQAVVAAAVEAHPQDPRALAKRVQQFLETDGFDRDARLDDLVSRLIAIAPDSATTASLEAQRFEAEDLTESAIATLQSAIERHPDVYALHYHLHILANRAQRPKLEMPALRAIMRLRATDASSRLRLAALYAQVGRFEVGILVIDNGIAMQPTERGLELARIDILDLAGKEEEAHGAYEVLLARTPRSASLHELYGRWLLARDQRRSALEAFYTALALEGQNEPLRQLVRYLDPEAESFEEPFLVTVTPDDTLADVADAHYGYLVDQKITRVLPNGLSSTYQQMIIEVLTEEGVRRLSHYPVYYTPDAELLEIDAAQITRPDGTIINVYDQNEFLVSDESIRMYYDYRQVVLSFPDIAVGDRLEIRYRRSQVTQSNVFDDYFGDVWFLQDIAPKRYARRVVLMPRGRELNIRQPASGLVTLSTVVGEEHTAYLLEARDLEAIASEPQAPGFAEIADYAMLSTFSSWSEVSTWYWNLIQDQLIVNNEIRAVVRELTDGVEDRRTRVERIHNYVVKNTRYVALEFGVHGFKPYRTTVCFSRRFGDCKDKASLIKVMLEEAGIPTNIVLVRTTQNGDIETDPPNLSIFDHAIAYVPEFDLFLDGTAEFSGTRELPSMDQDVTVLIVQDGGGHELRRTPLYDADANHVTNSYAVTLEEGGARIDGTVEVTGQFAPRYRKIYESEEKRANLFEAELGEDYPGALVEEIDFGTLEDLESNVAFRFRAKVSSLFKEVGGQRLLLPLGHKSTLVSRLAPILERAQPLLFGFPYVLQNTITYTLPEGWSVAEIPPTKTLTTDFGEASLAVTQDGDAVVVTAVFALTTRRIEVDAFSDYRQFIVDAEQLYNAPITLEKTRP